jgi:hypothetical protein
LLRGDHKLIRFYAKQTNDPDSLELYDLAAPPDAHNAASYMNAQRMRRNSTPSTKPSAEKTSPSHTKIHAFDWESLTKELTSKAPSEIARLYFPAAVPGNLDSIKLTSQ